MTGMRILVGSDLSEAADEAVRQALVLARDEHAELALCHVLPEPQAHTLFPQEHERDLETLQKLEPRIAEALRAQVVRLNRDEPLPVSVFVEHGSAYGELVNRAEAWRADLVIIGNHGRAQLKHLFLGSVAEQVARYAPCSALIARTHDEGVVLVATDLSDPSRLALTAGAREAARRKRPLAVVHATDTLSLRTAPAIALLGVNRNVDPPEVTRVREELSRTIIESALTPLGAKADIRIVNGNPAEEILRLVESLPAELLVLGTRGRSDVTRIMLGGVAANMVRNAACSVWAIRARST